MMCIVMEFFCVCVCALERQYIKSTYCTSNTAALCIPYFPLHLAVILVPNEITHKSPKVLTTQASRPESQSSQGSIQIAAKGGALKLDLFLLSFSSSIAACYGCCLEISKKKERERKKNHLNEKKESLVCASESKPLDKDQRENERKRKNERQTEKSGEILLVTSTA